MALSSSPDTSLADAQHLKKQETLTLNSDVEYYKSMALLRILEGFTAGGPILKKTGVVWAHLLRAYSLKDCSDAVLEESCDRSRWDHVSVMKSVWSVG